MMLRRRGYCLYHFAPCDAGELWVLNRVWSYSVDTGSPVTIISLTTAMEAMATERSKYPSVEERNTEPNVALKSYGGQELDMTSQVSLSVSRDENKVTATVLVQSDAPYQLLLGTDLQSELGFAMVTKQPSGTVDLLTGKEFPLDDRRGEPVEKKSEELPGDQPTGGSSGRTKE
jgi:hypothetical protein